MRAPRSGALFLLYVCAMRGLAQDIRFATRSLRRASGTSAVAIVTLAAGIALVSTLFAFINSVFYRPLPYADSQRIVALTAAAHDDYPRWSEMPLEVVEAMRPETRAFERIAAFREQQRLVRAGTAEPFHIDVTEVDSAAIGTVGLRAQRGRMPSAEEIRSNAPVAVISDSLWRTHFARSDSALGAQITVDEAIYRIVGVMPVGVRFYRRSDVIIPLTEHATEDDGDAAWYSLLGKLRPGFDLARARADVREIGSRLASADQRFRRWSFLVRDGMFDRNRGLPPVRYLWVLVGVAACALLIACTNVANLLLVRAAERRSEMAIRASLGASRWRLVSLTLVESTLLGAAAGAIGLLFTYWGNRILIATLPLSRMPSWIDWGIDWRVAGFASLLALIAVLAIGVTPAFDGARVDLSDSLRGGGGGILGKAHAQQRGRRGVVVEIAVALAMCVCAGLLVRSYNNHSRIDRGFDAEQVLVARASLYTARYATSSMRSQFHIDLAARIASTAPATRAAFRGRIDYLKLDAAAKRPTTDFGIYVGGDDRALAARAAFGIERWVVSDALFGLLNIRTIRGTSFDATVERASSPAAVISEAAARAMWGVRDPVGQSFRLGKNNSPITVIGVVSDVPDVVRGPAGVRVEGRAAIYLSERQAEATSAEVLVHAASGTAALVASVRAAANSIDRTSFVDSPRTLASASGAVAMETRVLGRLIGVLAACALVLSIIGTYAVIAYGVAQRTREIGLRVALGGTPAHVLRLFVADGMRLVGTGVCIGVLLALATSRVLSAFLLEVSPFDAITYVAVVVAFAGVAIAACYVPATRATRIEPMIALRGD